MYMLLVVFMLIALLLLQHKHKEHFSYQTFFTGPTESLRDSSDIYNSYLVLPEGKQPPRPAHYRTIDTEPPLPYSFADVGCNGRSSHACRRDGVAVGHQGIF